MNEARRRAYLEAMEIPSYIRRENPEPEPAPVQDNRISEPGDTQQSRMPRPEIAPQAVDSFKRLRAEVKACTGCSLATTRTQTVFGVGDEEADLLIIGEAPGADEDRQGEPFVGRAGQLLNNMLKAIGLDREQVFIANILKCRPPGNRNPTVEEAAACHGFLDRQIELLQPRVILSLGAVSAHNLLQNEDSVGRLRQRIHQYGAKQIPLIVTYHPAYLLRRPEEKAKAWQDLQRLCGLLKNS